MGLFGGNKRDKDGKVEKNSHYYHEEKGDQCSEYGPPALISPQANFPFVPLDNFGQIYPQQQDKFSKYVTSNPFQQGFPTSSMFYSSPMNPMNIYSSPSPPSSSSSPYSLQLPFVPPSMMNQQQQIFSPMSNPPIGMNFVNPFRDQFNPFIQQQQQPGNPFSPYQQMNYFDPMYYQQNSYPYGYVPSTF